MRVLITGGTGFIGSAVASQLSAKYRFNVRVASRAVQPATLSEVQWTTIGDLSAATDWGRALAGVDVVIHAAARAHIMRDRATDPLAEFRRANVDGTLALARQAVQSGVKRLIFLSTIKVHGERSAPGRPFCAEDPPAPAGPYARSKWEAEQHLRDLLAGTNVELVIMRLPLVYGPGVKANFNAMMNWLWRGIPLPLGAVRNRRTLIGMDNLVSLLACAIEHPAAPGQVLLAGDREAVSTTHLLRRLGDALNQRARLIPVPPALLRVSARLVGQGALMSRLLDSLEVDVRETRERLNWQPPSTLDQELARTATAFLAAYKKGDG